MGFARMGKPCRRDRRSLFSDVLVDQIAMIGPTAARGSVAQRSDKGTVWADRCRGCILVADPSAHRNRPSPPPPRSSEWCHHPQGDFSAKAHSRMGLKMMSVSKTSSRCRKRPTCYRLSKGKGGEPNRIRTCDPLIKSQLLYQLSYGPITGRLPKVGRDSGQAQKRAAGEKFSAGLYAPHGTRAHPRPALHENARARQ